MLSGARHFRAINEFMILDHIIYFLSISSTYYLVDSNAAAYPIFQAIIYGFIHSLGLGYRKLTSSF